MKPARKTAQALAAIAILLGTSSHALAVNVGGLEISVGSIFSVAQTYQNVVDSVGDTLSGYGKVDSINSIAVGDLCTGCELTYAFSDYTVTSLSATQVTFAGGRLNVYLGFGADKDFTTQNAGGSAGDLAEATNGTLFLSMIGHAVDAAGNTFIGTGLNINTTSPTGFGTGLLDVDATAGGIASTFFDTNSIPASFGGPADSQIGASFTGLNPVYPAECPGGPACVRGSADLTGTVTNDGTPPTAVAEPGTLLLLGLAFVTAAVATRRKQR